MADVINPRDLLLANSQRTLPVEIPHSAMKGTTLSNPTMGVIANLMEDLHAKSSPETPSQTLGRIFLRYKETLAAVRVGDIASRGALPAIAKEYIEQARKYYASSSHYQEIYKNVIAELEMLLEPQQTPVSSTQNLTPMSAAPVVADDASGFMNWTLIKPQRFPGYRKPLYDLLKAAHTAGQSCPKARDVLDKWKENPPPDVATVTDNGLKYYGANGNTKPADLEAIRKAIDRMIR